MKHLVIIILAFCITILNAQDTKFTATISKNPISVGERAQIIFSVNDAGSNFRAPDFAGLRILSGPNQSTSMSIVNGNMTREYSFSFFVEATKEGTYNINPATVTVNGKQIKSNSLKIEVMPETQAQKLRREQQEDDKKTLNEQAEKVIADNLFVKLSVNKSDVYVGEQVVATYVIYVHPELNLVNLEGDKLPSFNGFWTQEIDIGKLQFERDVLNGVPYNKAIVKKVILFPQRSGKLEVEPYGFKFTARLRVSGGSRSRDPFEGFFGSSNYKDFEYTTQTNSSIINVKELPANAPASFINAVGDLKMEAWFDKTVSVQNDPFTLKVKISGKGNLQLMEPLQINFPPGFEAYEPKIADNINVSASGVTGNKTFEYLIMPRNEGKYDVGPIEFTYFDLESGNYKTLNSDKFQLTVNKGDGDEGGSFVSGIKKEDVELLGSDIRFIKTNANISKDECDFFASINFIILSLLPIFAFIALIIFKQKQDKDSSDINLVKNRKANKMARQRLSKAKSFMTSGDKNKFYEELTKALWGYAGDKLSIATSLLNKDNLKEKLIEYKVADELANEFISTINECEFARYAPDSNAEATNSIYEKSVKVITEIEGALK